MRDNPRVSYALFDEAGKFLAGRILSEAESSIQIELESGKRVKVKTSNILLRFDQPTPAELLESARQQAGDIDLHLAWTFAPEDEFGFADLAREYFDVRASTQQQVATLLRLFDAPHYFRRAGRGRFRKAPEDTLKAALVGIERKKQLAAQIGAWASDIGDGHCPSEVRDQIYRILFKPDKNSAEYKAVVEAARRTQRSPLDLLQAAGAIDSPYQFHWRRFLFEQFPGGTAFPAISAPGLSSDLPLSEVSAFSIDDSHTTEIDDALSVSGLGSGTVRLGIHIAAPALAIAPGSDLDRLARQRLSTVYMPGWKLTMLPDAVVQAMTLTAGQDCPAVSAYFDIDEDSLEVGPLQTRIERVRIASNLRHDLLDAQITEESLLGTAPVEYPHAAELAFAFRLARNLKARREQVRGKPETFNRPDYTFRLEPSGVEPSGHEVVQIGIRRRGAPLDLIVAEAMILANCRWGELLAKRGVPGIYRSQASLLPGIKVRMGTKPMPHAGLGVSQYTWATSPLRRYVDLVNQWQIIACARHGSAAALAAPFKPKDAALYSVISGFESAYAAYNDFQNGIERYWTLRWIQQNTLAELDATVMKDAWVRADTLPLVFRVPGTESLPRGTRVRARVVGVDLLTLELHTQLQQQLQADAGQPEVPDGDPSADDDGEDVGSALTLAIDVNDALVAEPDSASAEAPTVP